ncbi:MAG: hypothetical protein ACRDJE_02230 [Dehalococcoidia bacterium]
MSSEEAFADQIRTVAERVIQQIASDPAFREQVIDDPIGALESAGFAQDVAALKALWGEVGEVEVDVAGYGQVVLANQTVAASVVSGTLASTNRNNVLPTRDAIQFGVQQTLQQWGR